MEHKPHHERSEWWGSTPRKRRISSWGLKSFLARFDERLDRGAPLRANPFEHHLPIGHFPEGAILERQKLGFQGGQRRSLHIREIVANLRRLGNEVVLYEKSP